MLEKIASEQLGILGDIRSNLLQTLHTAIGYDNEQLTQEPPAYLVDFERYLVDMLVEIKDYTERLKEII